MIVAFFLRAGGAYDETHVRTLARMVQLNLRPIDRIVCFTDVPQEKLPGDVEVIPLKHREYESNWTKLEMFRPVLRDGERVLHIGLNCAVIGDLRDIAAARPNFVRRDGLKSTCLMLWTAGELNDVYRDFARNPIAARKMSPDLAHWLGQKAQRATLWENLLPEQVIQYASPWQKAGDARVVCFDGWTRPSDSDVGEWIANAWASASA